MTVQSTSRLAYDDLRASLNVRQQRVLTALFEYHRTFGFWPTAYELYEAMKDAGQAKDLNDVRPRLTELHDEKYRLFLVEPMGKRRCRVTRKTAMTWRPTRPERLF